VHSLPVFYVRCGVKLGVHEKNAGHHDADLFAAKERDFRKCSFHIRIDAPSETNILEVLLPATLNYSPINYLAEAYPSALLYYPKTVDHPQKGCGNYGSSLYSS